MTQTADLFGEVAQAPQRPPRRPTRTVDLLPRDERGRFLGRFFREDGIRRAKEAERAEWHALALDLLSRFIDQQNGREFALENFRAWALARGLIRPHIHHVLGGLPKIARAEGLIEPTGIFRYARSPRTHSHPVALWRKTR